MPDIDAVRRVAEVEFADIVKTTVMNEHKLRIILNQRGFVDANISRALEGKFGFHWECMDVQGTIFRYDNFPDKKWRRVSTYPFHFHDGSQQSVMASPFPHTVIEGFRAFMEFIRTKLTQSPSPGNTV